jgi:DNA polymerase alpha-associated DNA helicase A
LVVAPNPFNHCKKESHISMAPIDITQFADKQLQLLAAELNAELEETALLTATHAPSTLARAGLALVNLAVSAQRTGLGGKSLIELSLDPAIAGTATELPEHGLRVGDIVGVSEQPKGAEKKKERQDMEKKQIHGVVVKVLREIIVVALDKDEVDIPGGKLWLWVRSLSSGRQGLCFADGYHSVKLANDVTYKRYSDMQVIWRHFD